MATTVIQTVPRAGKRMVVVGLTGLLLGGLGGGIGGWLMRHGTEQPVRTAGTSASTEVFMFSPEALRQYVAPASTEVFSPEAIRARNGS